MFIKNLETTSKSTQKLFRLITYANMYDSYFNHVLLDL